MHKVERKHFPVLLTAEERNKLDALAKAAKVLASDWIRDTIAKAYKRQFGDRAVRPDRVKTDPVSLAAKKA